MPKRALFLVGSPKKSNSTSQSMCGYLIDLLNNKGFQSEKLHILTMLGSDEGRRRLISSVNGADIVIFSSPLYVDTLPYFVIEAMELILESRKAVQRSQKQRLLGISNCGFPEASQNDIAILNYRRFAEEGGFEWIGGLSFCMGVASNGKSMKALGRLFPGVKRSFMLTASAITQDSIIPQEAIDLAAVPFIPTWLYMWLGNNITWNFLAIKNRAGNINFAPYK